MKPRTPFLILITLAALHTHAAAAQYRSDVPAVVTPRIASAPASPGPSISTQFAAAYEKAGRPRIAVYWNRELTDAAGATFESYQRVTDNAERHTTGTSEETITEVGKAAMSNSGEFKTGSTETVSGRRATHAQGVRPSANESTAWRLESSFYHPFLASGANLVDRNASMRATSATAMVAAGDAQVLEAAALMGKADLLMEVLMTDDNGSPIGCRFRVTIKDVRSGRILGLLSTRAIPVSNATTRYVAASGGFKKETQVATPNLEDFAHRLAEESMYQLVRSWAQTST